MSYTARQIADAVVCAVLEADDEYKRANAGERTVRLGDAVMDTLKAYDVALPRPDPPALDTGTEP